MTRLPVIVGYGGINAAGRSSFNHMYNRLVIDKLSASAKQETYQDLALMMGLIRFQDGRYEDDAGELPVSAVESRHGEHIRNNTLIRKISKTYFDVEQVPYNSPATLYSTAEDPAYVTLCRSEFPGQLPSGWKVAHCSEEHICAIAPPESRTWIPTSRPQKVRSAAQLPSGFEPGSRYNSHNHPRGLQMAVFAASDAIQSVGIEWQHVLSQISPDQISVYAGSLMGQLDESGIGGMMNSWLRGKDLKSTQLSLGLTSMCTDFVSAYVLSSLGSTGSHQGACASFLYNLEHAVQDIQAGKSRVAIVGGVEAPITPEIIEGFRSMGALADVEKLLALSNPISNPRWTSRPFGDNCGFTIAESAQYLVLFDDELAIELGANILGSVPCVFVNSDGNKKSITAPGVGNYITLAKAVAEGRNLLGDDALRHRTYVHAHATSTPMNRTTESHVLDTVARSFGITKWPVAAIKAYLGHSLASAAGDQVMAALGVWAEGWIPGIFTLDQVADDVHAQRLELSQTHREVGVAGMDATFINSKGFGGNNATALMLAPHKTRLLLAARYSHKQLERHAAINEKVKEQCQAYKHSILKGQDVPLYRFGSNVLDGKDLVLSDGKLRIPGYVHPVSLSTPSPYSELVQPQRYFQAVANQ